MMIEVMPFLHIMCGIIEEKMAGADSHSIVATMYDPLTKHGFLRD
jgi:hypothetical protein